MIAHPRHFIRFLDGRTGNRMVVGFLPGSLGAYLHTLETEIAISRDYAHKLVKHKIRYEGFEEIQKTIDNGICMQEGPNHLSFLFIKDKVKPRIYFLLVKTNKKRDQLWLVTFHRIHTSQYNKRLKPRQIIRQHTEMIEDADE